MGVVIVCQNDIIVDPGQLRTSLWCYLIKSSIPKSNAFFGDWILFDFHTELVMVEVPKIGGIFLFDSEIGLTLLNFPNISLCNFEELICA